MLEGSPVRQLERDRSGLAGLLADSQAAEETRNIMGEDDASGFLPALHLFDGRSVKPRLPQLLSVAVMASGFPLSKQDRGKCLPFSKASSGRSQVDPWKWTPPWRGDTGVASAPSAWPLRGPLGQSSGHRSPLRLSCFHLP